MTTGLQSAHDPPGPPQHRPRIKIYRFQLIGLPFLAALPILALLGVFGERWDAVAASDGSLAATVHYPTALRYKMIDEIEMLVSNRGGAVIDTVTVALDTAYASRFSTINAVPQFTRPFEIGLAQIQPGESRRVRIEIQGERYWSHSGELTFRSATDTVRIHLTTMVFP